MRITSPSHDVFINGDLTVQVVLDGAKPDSVQLRLNGEAHVDLLPPYHYVLDSKGLQEGEYRLTAVAVVGKEALESAGRTVVVDRTPPSIVSRIPASGADDVRVEDPIVVTFSEPVLVAGGLEASMTLERGGTLLGKTVSLSEDARELKVLLLGPLKAPATIQGHFSSTITDRAGNALVGSSWSWELPSWISLSGGGLRVDSKRFASNPALALTSEGFPVVAWSESGAGLNTRLQVERWTGKKWENLGGRALVDNPALHAVWPNLVMGPGDQPILAWTELNDTSTQSHVLVSRWNGSAWMPMGERVKIDPTARAGFPSLAGDQKGNLYVAWAEGDDRASVYLKRWNGTGWEQVGGAVGDGVWWGSELGLAVDPGGAPVLAFESWSRIYMHLWDGSSWAAVGEGHFGHSPFLAIDGNHNVFVASVSNQDVYVSRWTGIWSHMWGGAGLDSGRLPHLSLDAKGRPFVFWGNDFGDEGTIFARWWNGSAWERVGGGSLETDGSVSRVQGAIDPSGRPIVAWGHWYDDQPAIQVRRYNLLP